MSALSPIDLGFEAIPACFFTISTVEICATSASAFLESSLFFTEVAVNGTVNSVQDNSTEDFTGDRKKRDSTQGVTFLEVSLLGDLDS